MQNKKTFKEQAPKIAMIMRARWAKEKTRADLLQQRCDENERDIEAALDALGLVLIGRTPCSICTGEGCSIHDTSRCYCLFPHRFRFDGSEGVT